MLFFTFLLCGFGSALANRTLDPLTVALARDLGVPAASVALLASAAYLPYALSQPVLGPVGDFFGKDRVIKLTLWIVAATTLASALAPGFFALLVLRAIGGAASGGIIPVTQALIGDLVAPQGRQLAIARFTLSMIVGQILGATLAGVLEQWIGWRGVQVACGLVVVAAAVMATRVIPARPPAPGARFRAADAIASYRTIFRSRRAFACYITTPIVGGLTFGLFPFVSPILDWQKSGGVREAGFIIAGFAIGSMLLSLSLPILLRVLTRPWMIACGGLIAMASLAAFAQGGDWRVQMVCFVGFGFGFFMLHNSIQYEVSEISQTARGAAYSAHAFFFFMGQFLGPILYRPAFAAWGVTPTVTAAGVAIAVTGLVVAQLFARIHRLGA